MSSSSLIGSIVGQKLGSPEPVAVVHEHCDADAIDGAWRTGQMHGTRVGEYVLVLLSLDARVVELCDRASGAPGAAVAVEVVRGDLDPGVGVGWEGL